MNLIGQRLGEFEIIELLGQGGMGAVFKARQTSLNRFVALRTLQSSLAGNADYIAHFRREALAAVALSRPSLVRVYSVGESDGVHWLAMEYVEGEPASARLQRQGRLEPIEAVAVAIQVASALDYAWRKAFLIHRDIKPENIFLSADGEVKLGDLGLAKTAGTAQNPAHAGAWLGTPLYMSPEQAFGTKLVDLRSDIYSLGCTLYHLLSGQPPYSGANSAAVILLHMEAPVPDLRGVWPECPPQLAAAVGRMMQKRPAERPREYEEVIADLRQAYDAMNGGSVSSGSAATPRLEAEPERTAPAHQRALRLMAWVGGALVACAFFGGPLYFAPWKKSDAGRGATPVASAASTDQSENKAGAVQSSRSAEAIPPPGAASAPKAPEAVPPPAARSALAPSAVATPVIHPGGPPDASARATLVVFNENDPDSAELARFYMDKRGIPKAQMVGLKCSTAEEISRDEYERTIAEPLRQAFTSHQWWKLREPESSLGPVESNKIRFVALMRGIPLKIAQAPNYPGDAAAGPAPLGTTNAAAVDSELAVLGSRRRIISGVVPNPYYRSFTAIADARHPELMLVCRLDAPSPEIVRRMITDGLAAEEEGLTGIAYVDARGIKAAGYIEGDNWLFAIANSARRHGSPVVLDDGPALFPEAYPMAHAALYFGWYAKNVTGPFVRPDFRFVRGAIAVHIEAFGASSLRDPAHHWAGPLLSAGAAATLGTVYEPYLALSPHLDIFHDRLRAGFTFAESAYMAQSVLSWMTTCVGDPLYRPFKGAALLEELPANGEWADFRKAGKAWFSANRATGEEALRAAAKKDHSGMIMEGLGLLQISVNDRDAALASLEQAREYYGQGEDAMRVAFHEIIQLQSAHRDADAQALARKMIAANPGEPSVDFLRALTENRASTPPLSNPKPRASTVSDTQAPK